MTTLFEQISSYLPEQYYPNKDSISSAFLTNYGSGGQSIWSKTGNFPILNPTGGPDGQGSWIFRTGNGSGNYDALRITNSSGGTNAVANPEITDSDYSAGVWFKIPPNDGTGTENTVNIFRVGGEVAATLVALDAQPGDVGTLVFFNPSTRTTETYDDDQWHYYATRVYFNGTNYTREIYLDGALWLTENVEDTNSLNYVEMGDNFIINPTGYASQELAHVYIAQSQAITAADIATIWSVGNPPVSTVYDVKHYDGTAWQQSIGQKYWDGTSWVDWNAVAEPQRWDGAQWVNLL